MISTIGGKLGRYQLRKRRRTWYLCSRRGIRLTLTISDPFHCFVQNTKYLQGLFKCVWLQQWITRCQQYAFRRGRSTAEPLAAIRRIADLAESTKQPVCMCFLDWSKAFDRIKQEKLIEARQRMSLPEKFINAIKSICGL